MGSYGNPEDKSLNVKIPFFHFNPIVTILSLLIIIVFIVCCCIFPEDVNEEFLEWKLWVAMKWTWLYIGSQDVWCFFMIILYFSKYSSIKLGKDDEEPEYSTITWFTMLFACGIGVGLFFYGVAEPIYHYTAGSRYYNDVYTPDNTLAQQAMMVTFYHWGVHGWICYSLIGALLGIIAYRENLPMTMKSCFYPLLGDKIFTWVGDMIDVMSVITTMFGVCTSLGLGVIQINAGLNIIDSDIPRNQTTQIIIIWSITSIATLSVLSGVGIGIRRLSELCFGVGMVLMTMILMLEDTWYILNLYIQSIGFYFQYLLQLSFHTDAFEMSGPSYGAFERSREKATFDDTADPQDGPEDWMDTWTIFYWGWWISWSPFVGMFIAKISRGRTIREFINGTLTAPMIYTFLWLAVFGGAGIRSEREAAGAGYGVDCPDPYSVDPNISDIQGPSLFDEDRIVVRLSCLVMEDMWFYMMDGYYDIGRFLMVFSLIGIILYFVTSSDSGSLVIDILSSNGDQDPPRLQRVFWALVEGGCATALLVAGGDEAVNALQTVAIVTGLPYTFLICLMCVSMWRLCQVCYGDIDPNAPYWTVNFLDFCTTLDTNLIVGWFKNCVLGPYNCSVGAGKLWNFPLWQSLVFAAIEYLSLLLLVVFHILELYVFKGSWAFAWLFYLIFATMVTAQRVAVRDHMGYIGNPVEDFFAALLCYPSVGQQIEAEMKSGALEGPPAPKLASSSAFESNEARL